MKTHIYKVYKAAAGALLLTAALAACTDDSREPMQENETPREGIFFSVTATQGEGAETRVSYEPNANGGMDVKWASGDVIYVGKLPNGWFSSENISSLTLKSGDEGGTTAQFEGEVKSNHLPADGETLYAFYGKAEKINVFDGIISYLYDGQRQIDNGGMAHLADYDFMTASTTYNATPGANHHFSFSHIGSMMKFNLSGLEEQTVEQLTLEAYDGSKVFFHENGFSSSISLDLGVVGGNGISIGSDQQLEAYLMLGETTKTAGQSLILHVTTADNKHYAARLTGANIDAGKIYTVDATLTDYGSGAFQGEGTEINPYQITSAGDLTKLMLMTNKGWIVTQEKHFKLTCDIDMKGKEGWILPIGTSSYWFEGTFSGAKEGGGNYSIYNLQGKKVSGYSGLFGTLTGATIKNVTVRGKIIINGYGTKVGGIAGLAENSTIENCISDCEISNTSTGTSFSAPTGGILGYSQRNNKVINCQNLGSVSSNSSSGGIIGYALDGGEITGCTNSGEITSTSTQYPAGGIIGYWEVTYSGARSTLTGCTHSGSSPASNKAGSIIGGYTIPSSVSNSSITITNSGGSGSITSNGTTLEGKWPAADLN